MTRLPPRCDLSTLLAPTRVAVVGATERQGSAGYNTATNLLEHSNFSGTTYLVTDRHEHLFGRATYPSLDATPDDVDVVLVVAPREIVPETLRAAQRRGAKFAVIMSGGFGEADDERGRALDQELRSILSEGSMRIVGPNCPGLMDIHRPLGLTIQPGFKNIPHRGEIGLVVQSGGIGSCLLQSSFEGFGYSYFFSPGNQLDLTIADYVEFLVDDQRTSVIVVAAESIPDGEHFKRAATTAREAGKPVVLLKSARTVAGRAAAASHTGAIVGSADAVESVARQVGATLVHDVPELASVAAYLSMGRRPRTSRALVFGCSGGAEVMAADALADHGVELCDVSDATAVALAPVMLPGSAAKNPIDLGSLVFTDGNFERGLEAAVTEPDAGALLVVFNTGYEVLSERWAQACVRVAAATALPIIPVWMSRRSSAALDVLEHGGLPPMRSLTDAARVASALLHETQTAASEVGPIAGSGVAPELTSGSPVGLVLEHTAKRLLASVGVRVTQERMVRARKEAAKAAAAIGYPVIAKVVSAAAPHRAGTGLVSSRIDNEVRLHEAWDQLARNAARQLPDDTVPDILVSEFVADGIEGQIGIVRDPEWGPFLALGLGGNWIETIRDVALVPLPASRDEIRSAFASTMLADYLARIGATSTACDAFIDAAVTVGELAVSNERLLECDLNPVIIRGEEAIVVDALLSLGDARQDR